MIKLRNNTGQSMQLDERILFPGQTREYPDSIKSYSSVKALISSGKISIVPQE